MQISVSEIYFLYHKIKIFIFLIKNYDDNFINNYYFQIF